MRDEAAEVLIESVIKLPHSIIEEYKELDRKCNEILKRIRQKRSK